MTPDRSAGDFASVDVDGVAVPYRIVRRARRRRLALTLDEHGLALAVPLRARDHELASFIERCRPWIRRRWGEWLAGRPRPLSFATGAVLPLLGEELRLEVYQRRARPQVLRFADVLAVSVRDADPGAVRRLLAGWYRDEALRVFEARVALWARRSGLAPRALALSDARTTWGSCRAGGSIRLNWRLVQAPYPVIDYVVVHELAHLAHRNHSPRFWALVAATYPQYRAAQDALARMQRELLRW